MKMIILLSALAGSASAVFAQGTLPAYPLESEIRLEVWNGTSWGNTVNASPGQQVEYRVVINYTGPRTDIRGLGLVQYQVAISNADNEGTSRDTLGLLRGDGASGYQGNMLSIAEGNSGDSLTTYGRVSYPTYGQVDYLQNRLRNFRHGGDAPRANAPAGTWLRVAGEFVTSWPSSLAGVAANATQINQIVRGISSGQLSEGRIAAVPSALPFVTGTTDLVLFRHAVTLSDAADLRTLTLSTFQESFTRAGSATSTDDRRYASWHVLQDSPSVGTYRTAIAIIPATIVIPTPGILAILSISGVVATRRRR